VRGFRDLETDFEELERRVKEGFSRPGKGAC